MSKFQACIGKMPADARPAEEQILKAQREQFKQQVADPKQKPGLKFSCRSMAESWAKGNPSCP